jgi:aldose sugar dehydrogenase
MRAMRPSSPFRVFLLPVLASLAGAPSLSAQFRIGTGDAADLYAKHCAVCHGADLRGGLGSSLLDGEWNHAQSDEEIARVIREGMPALGMNAFKDILTEEQTRSLVIYMREMHQLSLQESVDRSLLPRDGVFHTEQHRFRLEEVARVDGILWSIEFLPDGDILLAEKSGRLLRVRDGRVLGPIEGTPEVHDRGQGGLLEVALHPAYAENGWVYLAFADGLRRGLQTVAMTKIVRGRLDGMRWVDEETIFAAPPETYLSTAHHFGTRLVFQDGYLFFAIGDRGRQDEAQDLSLPNGKVHRVHDDGRIPSDNPFRDRPGAFPTLWTYGNRNPQGLDLDPRTGDLWSTEHGPRGGDETNLILPGRNYGWPVITHGMNYNGTPITEATARPGMEQPVVYWTPSIAVCGIDFYEGARFPAWQHDLFVAGLASQELRRLVIRDQAVVHQEIVLKNQGRVRDVASGPDGLLYVTLMNEGRDGGRLCRLVPVD